MKLPNTFLFNKLGLRIGVFFVLVFLFVLVSNVRALDPQYVFVRKSNTCSNCYLWNGYWPEQYNDNAILEILNTIGTRGTNSRRLGIGVAFNILENGPTGKDDFVDRNKRSLKNLLDLSYRYDLPVFIVFDTNNWWESRYDLWNWFDPSLPGYNPDNVYNVEWTCWEKSCAIKKSWRNWGNEIEVKPHPNYGSSRIRAEIKSRLDIFLPIVFSWYKGLLVDKKYLLGGISLAGEIDIGTNFYYYPNGVRPNFGGGLVSSVQLGYNSVRSLGIKNSGKLESQDLSNVIINYLNDLNSYAYKLGIPRNKIFNHVGGKGLAPFIQYPSGVSFVDASVALSEYAQPGWSFYGPVTNNPSSFGVVAGVIDRLGYSQWGVPEWLTFSDSEEDWLVAFRSTLSYRNNRFLNVANWEDIKSNNRVIYALRRILQESPSCWVESPEVEVITSGNSVNFRWKKGANTNALFLNVTTDSRFNNSGTFKNVNVRNELVTNRDSYSISNLPNDRYYWLFAADGCNGSSYGQQRRVIDGYFDIGLAIRSDLNNDGKVDIFDYNILVSNFGKTGNAGFIPSDINKDGKVDIFDYNILVSEFGR